MQIKVQLGKLTIQPSLEAVITDQQITNAIALLPIALPHILAIASLPSHHRDPFDRMIIAQTMQENAVVVSVDAIFRQYPIQVLS